MNVTRLEQLHQRERDDETDSGPFEASQSSVKHCAPIVAQAIPALNSRRVSESYAPLQPSLPFSPANKPDFRSRQCEVAIVTVFLCAENWFLVGNALTAIVRFVYARLHD